MGGRDGVCRVEVVKRREVRGVEVEVEGDCMLDILKRGCGKRERGAEGKSRRVVSSCSRLESGKGSSKTN